MALERLLPDIKLGELKLEWKMKIDSDAERDYDRRKAIIICATDIMNFANKNQLICKPPLQEEDAVAICNSIPETQGCLNDFTKHGPATKLAIYKAAAAAGYNIVPNAVQKKLDRLSAMYHSYIYVSFSSTGRLLD